LVDLDPQGQCAISLGMKHEPGIYRLLVDEQSPVDVVRKTGRKGLWLLPGNKRTATAQIVLYAEGFNLGVISERLARLNGVDFMVFDTAPSVGGLQEAAICASDLVIVPTATNYLCTEGVVRTMETLATLKTRYGWQGSMLGILPTFFDSVTTESRATLVDLRAKYDDKAILKPIHRATVLEQCAAEGLTIWEKRSRSRAAQEYAALVWRVSDAT